MKTITLTLSTNDFSTIQRSLLYTAVKLQNESHSQQNSPEVRDIFIKASKEFRDILDDISIQREKQRKQEDAE